MGCNANEPDAPHSLFCIEASGGKAGKECVNTADAKDRHKNIGMRFHTCL